MGRAKVVSVLVGVAALLATASVARAQQSMGGVGDVTNRWGVGVSLGYAIPQENDADSSFYRGAVITYGLAPNYVVQLDIGYLAFSQAAHSIDYGDLQGVPLMLSLQWRHPYSIGTSPAAWYLLGGVGWTFWNLDSSDEAPRLGVEASADDAFAARGGLGFDVFFTDNLAWNVEGSYTFSARDVKLIEPGTNDSEKQDSDYWLLASGVRYYI